MTTNHKNHPFKIFSAWYEEAQQCAQIKDASAMCLSTANRHGAPSSRMVLLKGVDQNSFIFYTNLGSRKSHEMEENQAVALCFYWPELGKQVRVEGHVERTSNQESDAYFAVRPRESQIGAWASRQSEELGDRQVLKDAFAKFQAEFAGKETISRPENWGGWHVFPERVEFWEEGKHRLHKRRLLVRESSGWVETLLYP